jgi:hypothetical protein
LYDPAIAGFLSADPNLSANLIIAKNSLPFKKRKVEKPLKRSVFYNPEQFMNINDDRVSLIVDASNNLNRYAYVNNNPLKYTDPDGFLAFRWHFLITFSASMATERGFSESLVLAWQTMAVDFGSQSTSPEDTVRHAMGHELQSRDQAILKTKDFISDSMERGNVADAIHATQDLATPEHAGKQWKGFGLNFETVKHIYGDILPSQSTINEAFKATEKVLERND